MKRICVVHGGRRTASVVDGQGCTWPSSNTGVLDCQSWNAGWMLTICLSLILFAPLALQIYSAFEAGSPNRIAVGSQVDLSDLKVKGDAELPLPQRK